MKSKFLEYLIRESSSFKSKIYQNRNTHLCPNFYFDQFINGYFILEKPIFGNFKVPLFAKLKKNTDIERYCYISSYSLATSYTGVLVVPFTQSKQNLSL